jgi:hypothetical protein
MASEDVRLETAHLRELAKLLSTIGFPTPFQLLLISSTPAAPLSVRIALARLNTVSPEVVVPREVPRTTVSKTRSDCLTEAKALQSDFRPKCFLFLAAEGLE